jgi:DNA processing protein
VAFGHLAEPGSRDLGELTRRHGPVEALRRLRRGMATKKLVEATAARLSTADPYELAERALERAERLGVRIVTPEDDEYPATLEDLVYISQDVPDPIRRDTYPPHCIWVRGGWPLAQACERSVAVVGARASTSYGEHVGQELGYGLAERGWTVVSGGAFGIDAAAHRGALAASGCTIAVLACGIDRPYPLSHSGLLDRIGESGLLISEWPPGADPHRFRFLIRNRVIAAATVGTVMVEAHARSGARFTLNRARDLNRMYLAVPGPVTSAASVGCHEALRDGATLVATPAQVIEAVGRIGLDLAPPIHAPARSHDVLSTIQARVLDGVRPRKIQTAEQIAAAVGLAGRDARRSLPELCLAGFVVPDGSGYRLARASDAAPRRRRR